MATITPTNQVSAATMAANWPKGIAANSQKWLNKYLNPRALFNANPAAAQASWQSGINDAMSRNAYQTGLAAADPAAAATAASTYGVNNYSQSGTNKAIKYARKTNSLAAALNQVLSTVGAMPRGRGANNQARMLAWSNGMTAYKGKITIG